MSEHLSLRALALVMAFACGLTVANLYYAQPLLDLIADSFHISQGAASVTVTLTQAGYAVGLLFVVPLGDLLENRRLITRTLFLTAAALVALAAAPAYGVFLAAAALVGLTSVVVQVLLPLAAHLAPEGQVGRFVGTVMSGLIIGVLLARTLSSAVAQVASWRTIYIVSAVAMVLLSALLRWALPERRPDHDLGYRQIMASVGEMVVHEPRLIRRSVMQATMFGAFTAFWTAIAFVLVDEHGFNQGGIALFALVGAGGAVGTQVAGRIADRGYGEVGSAVALLLASGMFVLAGLGHRSVVVLGVAAVLLDFAAQSHQVISQHVIYTLRPTQRARVNTIFMVTMFIGGTVSSALAGRLHAAYGWTGVCWLGFALPLVGLVVSRSGRHGRR